MARSPLLILGLRRHCLSCRGRCWSSGLRYVSHSSTYKQDQPYACPAQELDENVTPEEKRHYENVIAQNKEKEIRTPWHREGSDKPPVSWDRSADAMTKGRKLLTTPSRLLKLVLPLTPLDRSTDRRATEPLALLVHPQQPLSYLERLIQSELPMIRDKDGKDKIPAINFRAEDFAQDSLYPRGKDDAEDGEEDVDEAGESSDVHNRPDQNASGMSNKTATTGNVSPYSAERQLRGGHGEGGVEIYSGLGREAPEKSDGEFVRWSKSTEIGDFIRDAARGKEFGIEIEGAPREIRVGVPSFGDRTYYLRIRLRKKARLIKDMVQVKRECDELANLTAQRMAYAGFGGMLGWGAIVAWLTFRTSLGWDTMEPVTYLVGLAGFMGGYAWFLFNKREASYRSAMDLTVSRRQQKLYEMKGFDVKKWEELVDEANRLRKEILAVAAEYDVEWDELRDAQDESVAKVMKQHRERKSGKKEGEGKKDGKDDDDKDD